MLPFVIDAINSLSSITDTELFIHQAAEVGKNLVDIVCCKEKTQPLLPGLTETLNLLRKGLYENPRVGQQKASYCTHISLMFVHLFHCKDIKAKLISGTPQGICKTLAHEYQVLIAGGRESYLTEKNILNFGKPATNHQECPMMKDIFPIMNDATPNHELVIGTPTESQPQDLHDIHLVDFPWFDLGGFVCMLKKLAEDENSSVAGKTLFHTLKI